MKVTPFLWFDGQAAEAAQFYVSVFKGKLGRVMTDPRDGKVLVASFEILGEESMCGWLKDKYGLSWQVCPDVLLDLMHGPKAAKVMQAFMQMKKFDIAKLKQAAA